MPDKYLDWTEARDEIAHILQMFDPKMTSEIALAMTSEIALARATHAMPPAPPLNGQEIVTEAHPEA